MMDLERLKEIPTLPVVAMRVSELINDPKSSSSEIAELLKKDQALTARLLKLANSSYYAIPGGVTDVQRALAFLGFNTLAQLVLSLSVMSMFTDLEGADLSMNEFWRHALGVAVCSEILAKHSQYPRPEEAFTCGLLHDIGKLVLFKLDPQRFIQTARTALERKCSFHEIEKEKDFPTHTELGEAVTEKWGLPKMICIAARSHHLNSSQISTIEDDFEKILVAIVQISNQICIKNKIGKSGDCSKGFVSRELLQIVDLEENSLSQIENHLSNRMEIAGAFLHAGS